MDDPYFEQVRFLYLLEIVAYTVSVKTLPPSLVGVESIVSSLSFPGLLGKLFVLYRFCG